MRFILLLCLSLKAALVSAQLYITDTNAYHFEDFDRLDSFGTASTALPSGWEFTEWGTAANTSYRAGTGSLNASDTYSFGPLRSRDRALGSLASGTLTRIVYGTRFVNSSGSDICAVSIAYKGEQWRRGGSGATDSLRCYFTTVRGTRLADTGNFGWTEIPELLFQSVSTRSGSGAVNGNDSFRVLHASIPLMLHPDDTLLIRWVDLNGSGSDDGLAIDSFSIRFINGPVTSGSHPVLIGFSPDSNASGLAPGLALELDFDRAVRPGPGRLYVTNLETATTDTVAANQGQLRNGGRGVVYAGLSFARGARYRVWFDSTAFDSLGYVSTGLSDDRWTFHVAALDVADNTSDRPQLSVMPDHRLLIVRSNSGSGTLRLRICDLSGRMCFDRRLEAGTGKLIIDPELAGAGCYAVWLECGREPVRTFYCRP